MENKYKILSGMLGASITLTTPIAHSESDFARTFIGTENTVVSDCDTNLTIKEKLELARNASKELIDEELIDFVGTSDAHQFCKELEKKSIGTSSKPSNKNSNYGSENLQDSRRCSKKYEGFADEYLFYNPKTNETVSFIGEECIPKHDNIYSERVEDNFSRIGLDERYLENPGQYKNDVISGKNGKDDFFAYAYTGSFDGVSGNGITKGKSNPTSISTNDGVSIPNTSTKGVVNSVSNINTKLKKPVGEEVPGSLVGAEVKTKESYALPGYNSNVQVTVYEKDTIESKSGTLKDVTGFNSEDNWAPKYSKWGSERIPEEELRATLALDLLDDGKHHLAGELYARAYANKVGISKYRKDILMSKANFDYILTEKSCRGEDTCLQATKEQLVNIGHVLGYIISTTDVLSEQTESGNYSLETLASTIEDDTFTSNYNTTMAAYLAPLSNLGSIRTRGTDNVVHLDYQNTLKSSLESCLVTEKINTINHPESRDESGNVTQKAYSTDVTTSIPNSANKILSCAYNNAFKVLETITGGKN